ncbi:BTAD domain-containing putative transcriptional regulator [Ruegeria hyattellae]|uniref:BTAD domain-containing putative transcriptional regulator n=1 Tax=Ruegeria hyattellae TaxID=3233337 RepID=UPI00355C31F0
MPDQEINSAASEAQLVFVRLLGPMKVTRDNAEEIELPRKVRAMFAYLVTRSDVAVPRQTLIGMFWGDRSETQARSSLRQALAVLRSALDDLAEMVLATTSESVMVRTSSLHLDCDQIDALLSEVVKQDQDQSLEFLEGMSLGDAEFDTWLSVERERMRDQVSVRLRELADEAEAEQRFDLAAARLGMLLRQIPTDENAHRGLIRLQIVRGKFDAAIRQFEKCRTLLNQHLDVAPDAQTISLWEEARRRRNAVPGRSLDLGLATKSFMVLVRTEPDQAPTIQEAFSKWNGSQLQLPDSNIWFAFETAEAAMRACVDARSKSRDNSGKAANKAAFAIHQGKTDEPGVAYSSGDLAELEEALSVTPAGEIQVSARLFGIVRRNSPYFFEEVAPENTRLGLTLYRIERPMIRQPFLAVYANDSAEMPKRSCSLAVAPIKFIGPSGSDDEIWSEGLTEDLILELSRTHRVNVSSRTTLFAIGDHDAVEIGKELGVGFVLSGSFRKMGDDARLNFSLSETDTGRVIWSEQFSVGFSDLLDILDDVVAKVVARIAGKIERREIEAARLKRPENMTAYEYYLRGIWHHRLGGITTEHSRKAVEWLSKSIEADPSFNRPRAMLACAWSDLPDFDKEKANNSVLKAYLADPNDPEASRILGWMWLEYEEYEKAIYHAELSVSLAPHDAYLIGRCAAIHIFCGDPEKGLERLEHAQELDPFVPVYIVEERLSAHYALENYKQIIAEARQLQHQTRRSRYYLAASLVATGDLANSKEVIREALAVDPALGFDYLRGQELFRDKTILARLEGQLRDAGFGEIAAELAP